MNTAFCTIITTDYIHYALALNESILRFKPDSTLYLLIADKKIYFTDLTKRYPNLIIHFFDELIKDNIGSRIYDKYFFSDMDCFRWSMKPVFINFLLKKGHNQVFFLDCDLFFFNSFDFLINELRGSSVLLSPHWRSSNPNIDENNFYILLTSGLYNGGFIGVSQDGYKVMEWWASVCANECVKRPDKGLFVDQGYLDLLPVYFDNVKILKHKGCNIANWNQAECKRIQLGNKVVINGETEIIFIHFTASTIRGIESGKDKLLKPYLEEQQAALDKFKKFIPLHSNQDFSHQLPLSPHFTSDRNATNPFLSPRNIASNVDKFHIRQSILDALTSALPHFHGKVLDVGCGQMPYKTLLNSAPGNVTEYIGLDFEDNPIHDNSPDITWDNGKIPLFDNSVDCAIATEVLEHCPQPEQVLSEVNRVLGPGGFFFFTTPFFWPLHEVPFDNYRYTPFALERILTNSGYTNIQLSAMGGWDASLGQMLGLWARRRLSGRKAKAVLSILLLPLIKHLYKIDHKPALFSESTMITGISGTCRKTI